MIASLDCAHARFIVLILERSDQNCIGFNVISEEIIERRETSLSWYAELLGYQFATYLYGLNNAD